MDKRAKHCNIVYVTKSQGSGWTWQAAAPQAKANASAQLYGLFYDCVLAARERGYTPATPLKCS